MFSVRPAKIQDAAALWELQQLAFAEEGRRSRTRDIPPLQEQASAILEHIQNHIALVAVKQEALVGSVRGVKTESGYVIRALIVHPSSQGEGIGSALLRALEDAFEKSSRIDLTTNTLMQGNVPFYEKHGYQVKNRTEEMPGIVLAHMFKYLAEPM